MLIISSIYTSRKIGEGEDVLVKRDMSDTEGMKRLKWYKILVHYRVFGTVPQQSLANLHI